MTEQMQGKFLGAVTVGERGQVVIPVEVRKMLQIKPGDKLVVMGKEHMVGLVPAETFNKFLNHATSVMEKIGKKKGA